MGIDKIKSCGEYCGIPINIDYSIKEPEKVFIGNGIGCHTFWFESVAHAKAFIDYYKDKINPEAFGLGLIPKEVCQECRNHYRYGTKEWREAKPNNCESLKKRLKNAVLRRILEREICHLRQKAYGFSACRNCPISCAVSQDNLNRLENLESLIEEYSEKLKKLETEK